MKVENHQDYELVFSIKYHYRLGAIIEPYIIAYTTQKTLSLTYQKVFSGNASHYTDLSEEQLRWISILDPIMPENLIRTFSKIQKIRPKEFFDKHFDQTVFAKQIRPFIDENVSKLIKALPQNYQHIYVSDEINPAHQKIQVTRDFSKVLFHFRKNENGTNYFATLKHDNQRFPYMKLGGLMLSYKPAILVVNKKLYRFYDFVDGHRLAVFLNKKFVHITPDQERKYYSSFVKKLLETSPARAEGFNIIDEQHQATPLVKLIKAAENTFALKLSIRYGKLEFWYGDNKFTHVNLTWKGDTPTFTRIRRSKKWEDGIIHALQTLGLKKKYNDLFIVKDGKLNETLDWLQNNKDILEVGNYEVGNTLEQNFNFHKPSIHYTIGEQTDWFDLKIEVTIGDFTIPFSKIIPSIKSGNDQYLLPDGSVFIIPSQWFALGLSLGSAAQSKNQFRVKKYQLGILEHIESKKIKRHINSLVQIKIEVPNKNFNGSLRPYQLEGLSWLMFLKNNHFGGILADDMGLGKTIQTLAFLQKIRLEKSTTDKSPILLVAPTSLLYNWKSECNKFTPDISTYIHSGPKRFKTLEELSEYNLIITSYGLIRNDFELLSSIEFQAIVLDESQYIKNKTTKTSQLVYKLESKIRIALTGTPIENSITDLWSQMQFLNKGMLGTSRQFEDQYAKPIEKEEDKQAADNLRKLIKPFVLRRTKQEVAKDLPAIFEKVVYCEMTKEQEDYYEETKSKYRNNLLNLIKEQGLAKSKLNVLQGLTKLRQIANHPKMVSSEYEGSSGKHNVLIEHIITALNEGHKVLVFSQFVSYLNILKDHFSDIQQSFYLLTGSTSKEKRNKMVQEFQETDDTSLFLISLKAGGTGLNLTAADYVFIVDPWWNPAAEAQARDRTHRIGQFNKVFSYKFISRNTIEEKILQLQSKKKAYSNDIIVTENNVIKNLDTSDIQNLFN